MVEFCRACRSSLPTGDLTIKNGQKYTSHDYVCAECGKLANPPQPPPKKSVEPGDDREIVISGGESKVE